MSLQCQCQVKRLCFDTELFTYVYMHIYVHIYEVVFNSPKTWSPNLTLALQHRFLDWRLTRFGKELFNCSGRKEVCSFVQISRNPVAKWSRTLVQLKLNGCSCPQLDIYTVYQNGRPFFGDNGCGRKEVFKQIQNGHKLVAKSSQPLVCLEHKTGLLFWVCGGLVLRYRIDYILL